MKRTKVRLLTPIPGWVPAGTIGEVVKTYPKERYFDVAFPRDGPLKTPKPLVWWLPAEMVEEV